MMYDTRSTQSFPGRGMSVRRVTTRPVRLTSSCRTVIPQVGTALCFCRRFHARSIIVRKCGLTLLLKVLKRTLVWNSLPCHDILPQLDATIPLFEPQESLLSSHRCDFHLSMAECLPGQVGERQKGLEKGSQRVVSSLFTLSL